MNKQQAEETKDDTAIDWSAEELQEWISAGLIPKELLDDSKKLEFVRDLMAKKNTLDEHYMRNTNKYRYIAQDQHKIEWRKHPDIIVRDEETGEIARDI